MTALTPAAARLLLRALERIETEKLTASAGDMPALTSAHLTVIRQLQDATENLIEQNGSTGYLDSFILRKFPRLDLEEIRKQLAEMATASEASVLPGLPAPSQNEIFALPAPDEMLNTAERAELLGSFSELLQLIEGLKKCNGTTAGN